MTLATRPHQVPAPPRIPIRNRRSPEVVAEILSDGTIRPMDRRNRTTMDEDAHGWSSGSLSGRGWFLWWERRRSDR
jgi:hypothetical protein